MPHYTLSLLGFGNVGRALARLLQRKSRVLQQDYDITFSITGIATGSHGRAVHPKGLDIDAALTRVEQGASLEDLSARPVRDNFEFIAASEADVLFENTPVSYPDGQPATDHLATALKMGMHAITANKGPVVHAYRELRDLAKDHGVRFLFESTVMDGAPVFALFRETLPAAEVQAVRGVLNSTTNLMLSMMEEGASFDQAVTHAQAIGIAETDPSGDVDGWDAAIKIAALATVTMNTALLPADVDRTGIRGLARADIEGARKAGKRWKLICTAKRDGDAVRARVAPEMVAVESPFYGVEGTTSIVQFETDVLGRLSLLEENPGPETTAYGLLADFLNAVRHS